MGYVGNGVVHSQIPSDWKDLLINPSARDCTTTAESAAYLLARARQVQRARQAQRSLFPPPLCRDSGWDILLNCFVARLEGRHLCVKQLHAELDESNTALLRRLADLERLSLLERSRDGLDGRRTLVELTPHAAYLIREFLERYAGD